MLLIFPQMTTPDMYRLVRDIYSEACIENASDKHPESSDLTEVIKEEEDYFVGFLKNFFAKAENTYYVLEEDGQWVSALRLTEIEDFYYMEALETSPEYRRKGYASALIREVISLLSQNGPVKIRSNVNKKNVASLATHRACGFTIEEENGINYLCGERYDHLYGMVYGMKKGEDSMYHSYVMGIGHAILELKSKGFDIRNDGMHYRVSFPKELSFVWEEFISQHLELGYWNEYLTESKVVFLFHLEDGIKRFEVDDFCNDEVLSLCEKLCECRFGSLKQMLAENRYYKEILCK